MKIYISPEVREFNTYATGGTNEHIEMTKLAGMIQEEFKKYGGEARVADKGLTVTTKTATVNGRAVSGRIADAVKWGADLFIGLHSNARGTATAGPARGPIIFYKEGDRSANGIALDVYQALTAIMPHDSPNGGVRPHPSFYEVTEPGRHGMTAVYIELEFHDQEDTARWIIENHRNSAKAIARGLAIGAGMIKPGEDEAGGGGSGAEDPDPETYPFDIPYRAAVAIQGYERPRWRGALAPIKRAGEIIRSVERADLGQSAFVKDNDTGGWYLVKADGRWQVSDARPKRYTVKTGDTLWSIAESELGAGIRYTEILAINQIQDPATIRAGQVLELPKR